MATRLIKKIAIVSILLFTTISAFAQPKNRTEYYTVVSIDSIYLENKGNQLALNKITSKNIQGLLGRPMKLDKYKEEWSDEYDKTTIYKYKLLTICFRSLEKEEWLESIDCFNSDISIIVNGIRLFVGQKDTMLNVFSKSWKDYKNLENTKYYQNKAKQGDTEKTLTLYFPIKKENYEYLGLIMIDVKDDGIVKIELLLRDEA